MDQYSRLLAMSTGVWFVDESRVCISDLVKSANPGSIVRCDGPPSECVQYIASEDNALGCVAGWISEE